jgi:integrase
VRKKLTDRLLRSLTRPKDKPITIGDSEFRTFEVRAGKTGVVSFSVVKRPPGSRKPTRFLVGTYPNITLAEARTRAREVLREIEGGVDPRIRKAEEARAASAAKANTFAAVAESFIARHVRSKRSARKIELLIRRTLIPRWGERPIASITRGDVIALVDEIVDRGHPEAAHTMLAYTRRLFSWAVPRYDLQHAPTDHVLAVDLIGARAVRQRVLDAGEIALIWRAAEGAPFARLLLLLGVRRSELGRATFSEFDLDGALWTVPAGRMKGNEPHVIPLPATAVEILRALPCAGDRVFGAMHYSTVKAALDARVAALNGDKALPRWTWHDCRRTFRTGLSTIGVRPDIAELCIAHRQKGLARVYDQHRFDREKRDAFALWERHLLGIVAPPADNVRPLRRTS